ncbi:MAG: divalent-cation tolerance protein CutA [Pedosphaera sp.]|nr:divalent-cation tolerance protein CutA [Pedosphaera sp.]
MKRSRPRHSVAWVTAPDLRTARRLARLALNQRLVACAQLRAGVESHYWWQGRLEKSREVLLTFKTTRQKLGALEKLVLREHPYDTPQFVTVQLTGGSARYMAWIDAETGGPPPRLLKPPA